MAKFDGFVQGGIGITDTFLKFMFPVSVVFTNMAGVCEESGSLKG